MVASVSSVEAAGEPTREEGHPRVGPEIERTRPVASGSTVRDGETDAGPSDEELFREVQKGDDQSLALLIKRYEVRLFALLFQLTRGDSHLADDLFQETFLRAMRARDTFDPSKRFRPWIVAIAVNLVRDEARKRKLQSEVQLGEGGNEAEGGWIAREETPEAAAERSDGAARVRAALFQLTEKERESIVLHFYDGLTLAEAAQVLDVPVGTVKSRLHGALARLKVLLKECDDGKL